MRVEIARDLRSCSDRFAWGHCAGCAKLGSREGEEGVVSGRGLSGGGEAGAGSGCGAGVDGGYSQFRKDLLGRIMLMIPLLLLL